jgi:hypothetical protein
VRRALERLGFRPAEAREAIAAVQGMADDQSGTSTFEGLLRAALCRVRLEPTRRPRRAGAELG